MMRARGRFVERFSRRVVRGAASRAGSCSVLLSSRSPAKRVGSRDVARRLIDTNGPLDLSLVVRWIDRPGEIGPSWSVFAERYELVRIDLFDDNPHAHFNYGLLIANGATNRCRWHLHDVEDAEDRIRWSGRELRSNLRVQLVSHPLRRVRRVEPSADQIERAAAWLESDLRRRYRERAAASGRCNG
ncbi:MAG: hypothetical protein AAGA42_10745 [Actinomycetota bacterium]